MTRSPLHIDELVEHWTILDEERDLIAGKRGATRLAFGILLKFYTHYGRFPRGRSELPEEAVEYVAKQVKVPASELGLYEWSGSTIEYHRSQIRKHLGFRTCSTADAAKVAVWLAENVAHAERQTERVREELLKHLREEKIEPPTPGRLSRIVGSALRQAEAAWSLRIVSRLDADTTERICALADITFEDEQEQTASAAVEVPVDVDAPATESEGSEQDDDEADFALLAFIKSAPGNVSLESMMTEIRKLVAVRSIGLPPGLFADVAPKVLAAWRARAAVEAPSHMRTRPPELAVLLLAALVQEREREITDTLVELLIATVHRIKARADSKVTKELINAFKRVTGKENILFKVADAALGHPEDPVREVIFPAVSGGEQTLRDLVHEFKTKGPAYRTTVQTTLRASYTNHYRRGLIALLETLEFKSTNTAYQPVIKALELVRRYAKAGNTTYYPRGEVVPEHRGTSGAWEDLVFKSMVVHSQTLRASASEVHAMVEGAVRHGTTMKVEGNYVDSHGQSEIGFGVTRLLGFDLLPRIKQINKVKLYRVESGESDLYARLTPAIRWDLIEQNYDQMIKYATAIKQGTAATEAILRRFTDSASHPTYQAMLEVGRAQKTTFVARYLRIRELQREIQEGLNVVESSNGANSVIFYGKGGDIATNRREELEMTVLCLRILQAALVYSNTLMLQDVLADPAMAKLLKPADRRGLTPLFWQYVQPYGEVRLDVAKRLPLSENTGPVQTGAQA